MIIILKKRLLIRIKDELRRIKRIKKRLSTDYTDFTQIIFLRNLNE